MQISPGTRSIHLGPAAALLATLWLTACGGGGGDGGGTTTGSAPAQAASTPASAPAPALSDLHVEGKTTGFKWSNGLTSITASTDIVTTGIFGAGCETSPTTGLQLSPDTPVAIGAHVDATGKVVADRITCAPAAGFEFDSADTGLRILGSVTYFVGVFGKVVPDSITVQSPPIDTTQAQVSGCDLDANSNLPAAVSLDARVSGSGYAAWRVQCH